MLVRGMRVYSAAIGSGTYSEYADLATIGAAGTPEAPDVDVTPVYDTVDARRFVPGLSNGGEFEFEQRADSSGARYNALQTDFRVLKNWRVTLPSPSTNKVEFQGYIKKLQPPTVVGNVDDQATIKVTVKVDGIVTHS